MNKIEDIKLPGEEWSREYEALQKITKNLSNPFITTHYGIDLPTISPVSPGGCLDSI
jgi:hypothetical protein